MPSSVREDNHLGFIIGPHLARIRAKHAKNLSPPQPKTSKGFLHRRWDWNHPTTNMATELTVQSERAYQKQPHIFTNHRGKKAKSNRVGKGGRRYYKDVGLGFRTPKTAINGTYIGQCALPCRMFGSIIHDQKIQS